MNFDLDVVVSIFVFITGISIGSFLNVVILRALSNESIVNPPSKCPKCQKPLKWWHNIPLLSYIFLRGKCAFCKEKISIQYPIVEFLTGYLYLMTFLKFGYTFNTIFIIIFISLFIIISTTDIKEHVAFNLHSYILAFFGILYNYFNFGNLYEGNVWIFQTSFIASILGLLLGAAIISAYFGLGYLVLKTMIIGPGDIFIAGALGACFGWKHILIILAVAVGIQILTFLPIYFVKLIKKKDYITLAEFLIFAICASCNCIYPHIAVSILLIIIGAILCKRILDTLPKNLVELNEEMLKNESEETKISSEKEEIFHLPFGPALCCASLLFIFLH